MIRVLVDTNVVIDSFAQRGEFALAADRLIDYMEEDRMQAYITASTATDIFHLLVRMLGNERGRERFVDIFDTFGVVSVTGENCREALRSGIWDFEDALLIRCAEKIEAGAIVTRDEALLTNSYARGLMNPQEFVDRMEAGLFHTTLHEDEDIRYYAGEK